jgi:hypothetical protein
MTRRALFVILVLCALQLCAATPASLSFKMVNLGVLPDAQVVPVDAAANGSWTASVAPDPASDPTWMVLNGGNGPVTGTGPGSFKVGLRDWMAAVQPAGVYNETLVITDASGNKTSIPVTYTVLARLPDPAFRYLSGPTGCVHTRDFPSADLDTCTVPGDWPSPMLPPVRGGSYTDANFGAKVHVLTDPGTVHEYSTPSAVSAGNTYLLEFFNNGPSVLSATTGQEVYTPPPHNGATARWDAHDDSVYYYISNAAFMKVNVATRSVTTLIDYAADGHGFTTITDGGTGDTSKDNWTPFWAPSQHQVCVLDIGGMKTYCADYSTIPGLPVSGIDFALVAKGVDRPTGKRYVLLMATPSMAAFSVNSSTGKLDFEYRGPESPDGNGNHDGVCDPGESCLSTPHTDTFEDSAGIQYLVMDAQAAPCEFALATYRLNAGPQILIAAELGGGRRRIMAIDKCSGPGPWPKDDHIGCAKAAPYCAISTTYNVVQDPAIPTLTTRTPHESELILMHDNGAEIIRLAELRSLRFTTDGDDGYWTEPRVCLSNDASLAIADSNFGQPQKVRTISIETGISPAAAAMAVTMAPATVTVAAGSSTQLTATVTGSANTTVVWSMQPAVGSISSSGVYTAPSRVASTQNVVVTATSVADPTKSGTATITIARTGPSGTGRGPGR